jgi:hypothetical protein
VVKACSSGISSDWYTASLIARMASGALRIRSLVHSGDGLV